MTIERWTCVLLVAGASASCAAPPPSAPAAAPVAPAAPAAPVAPATAAPLATAAAPSAPAGPMTVMVLPETTRGGKTVYFGAGDPLKSRERFALSVFVDQPALLWVLYCSSDKKLSLVHPAKGAPVTAEAGKKTRIPRDGDWFELDDKVGSETLYVIASRGTIAEVDPDVARVIDKLTGAGELTCEPDPEKAAPPRAPPPSAGAAPKAAAPKILAAPRREDDDRFLLASKGFRVVHGKAGDDARGNPCQATPEGLAVCRLWFKHE